MYIIRQTDRQTDRQTEGTEIHATRATIVLFITVNIQIPSTKHNQITSE